jgi:hypothetical protein
MSAAAPTPKPAPQSQPESGPEPEATPGPASGPEARRRARLDFGDPLDSQSPDDTDQGWGERPSGGDSAADLARFLDEKPPHHV